MSTVEELQVLLAKAQEEANEARAAKAQFEASYKLALDEVKNVAEQSYKLLESLEQHMKAGDALRRRLAKVTDALAKAETLLLVMEKHMREHDDCCEELPMARAAYAAAKLFLQTSDDVLPVDVTFPKEWPHSP